MLTNIDAARSTDAHSYLDGQILMGTSAPIQISHSVSNRYTHEPSLSKPSVFSSMVDSFHIDGEDTFKNYLKRDAELKLAHKMLKNIQILDAKEIYTRKNRFEILPRFALKYLEVDLYNPKIHRTQFIAETITRIHTCKQTCQYMLRITDSQAITLALSDVVTKELHKLAGTNTRIGSFEDVPGYGPEHLFWKYWQLDLDSCLADIYLYQGLLQLYLDSYMKNLGLIDDRWVGIRTLYQLSTQETTKCINFLLTLALLASALLLYVLGIPVLGYYTLPYPSEQREIMTMVNRIDTIFRVSPLHQYLTFLVYRRLGSYDYSFSVCQNLIALETCTYTQQARYELAVLYIQTQNFTEASAILGVLWNMVDVSLVTLLLVGVQLLNLSEDVDQKIMDRLQLQIVPHVVNEFTVYQMGVSSTIKTIRKWLGIYDDALIRPMLLYWFLYYQKDLASLASSRGSIPLLINLAVTLDTTFRDLKQHPPMSTIIHGLVLGTLVKYLAIHQVDTVTYFSDRYPTMRLGDISRQCYRSAMTALVDLEDTYGIQYYVWYEYSELESIVFGENQAALDLIHRCVPEEMEEDRLMVTKYRPQSASPPLPQPSFARDPSRRYLLKSAGSVTSEGILSSSASQIDWGMESRLSMAVVDIEPGLELLCLNAQKYLMRQLKS
ncbi:hypothetical protein BC833DRAFT_567477 [Globomyces pollinis-pini]|nr:hypothetical protein BC833DRAFT_567477 [Globomyces pollinis-pini]